MKKLLLISLLFLSAHTQADYYAKVTYVYDGDTISVTKPNNTKYRVRLVNIDAPEVAHKEKAAPAQPYSAQAKQYLMSMVMNQNVLIKEHGTDNYGRFLGEVYLNKLNVNKAMVASGYAWAYRYKLADQEYLQLENNARTKKIGLWKSPNPINPYEWRKIY
ncbi:thermonuclease family protein [Acinetobacter baumannii]|uniref:thermonuclease family protein n=1 Tax=Acinetobacter baumannii TaxID=470 RepID=UPI0008DE827C|nr:thermonuclease family protein [Acinetobacter baumannii]MCE6930366.1 thermonuclease family protein [Acinetobacter baumannii]MCZ0638423.1 thermonuclease family protein [Acinetobacter baumannii]MVO43807.1 chromosome partitioning protein ParB [Acinetobacter baumannii]OIB66650.1 chromosome partitioning protein ParB [Acinetobacter baumannii]OIE94430.1 chromosome partitioning protein ParB [Acinetobacter baumannii]